MNRRDFIRAGTAAVAASLLPLGLSPAEPARSVVWEITGAAEAALRALFAELGGIKALLRGDPAKASVLIKPNLCLPHPGSMATTTSPEAVDALCTLMEEAGLRRIVIADHTLQNTNRFGKTEIARTSAGRPSVELLFANERRHFQPQEVEGKVLKETEVMKLLPASDLVVNFATAKHHSATGVSLGLKNLMGTIWNRSDFHTKLDLDQAIGDLALAVRPGLNLIDASRILLNGGPTGPGPVKKDGRLFASTDIVALDSVVASRYDFGGKAVAAKDISHIVAAHKNGLGEMDTRKIEIRRLEA
jgi:uncharacterized protein (DUF362 family)